MLRAAGHEVFAPDLHGQGDDRTDQAKTKGRLQQSAAALCPQKVQAKHVRSVPFVVSRSSPDPFGCRKGVLSVAIAVTCSKLFGISILELPRSIWLALQV